MLSNLPSLLESIWAFIQILIGFGILIFVHELGHFLAAKAVRIKVTQFAIGFGHSMFTWRKGIGIRVGSTEQEYENKINEGIPANQMGETEYRVNWIPLGGYVKMLGQDDLDPTASSDDPRSFTAKSFLQRTLVISAGVVMNAVFAIVFFIAAFMYGVEFDAPVVGGTVPGSPAATTYAVGHENDPAFQGLKPGDQIIQINNQEIEDFTQVATSVALSSSDEALVFIIKRENESELLTFNITPVIGTDKNGLLSIGITPAITNRLLDEEKIPLSVILVKAGVEKGMIASQVNGIPVERFDQMEELITQRKGLPLPVTFTSDDKPETQIEWMASAMPLLVRHPNQEKEIGHLLGMVPATSVQLIQHTTPAEKAGLQIGDVIKRIGDVQWPTPKIAREYIQQTRSPVELTIIRNGQEQELVIPTGKDGILGIIMLAQSTLVRETLPQSPFSELYLNPGSKIIRINEQSIMNLADMQRILQKLAIQAPNGFEINVVYQPNLAGQQQVESNTLKVDAIRAEALINAGWSVPPQLFYFESMKVNIHTTNPGKAISLGIRKTYEFMMHTYLTIYRVAEGSVPVNNLQGPVGIFNIGTKVARRSTGYLLFFLGLISINLAVINFLPIPILDGGLMVFLIIEKIKGSPASAAVQTAASIIGLAFIGCLILFLTYNDIARLFE